MKTLYFVRGNPTKAQGKEAEALGAYIRNANAWHAGDFVEKCDAVAGDVPEGYAHIRRADKQDAVVQEQRPKPEQEEQVAKPEVREKV